jgi:hypothetical protein
MPPRNSTGFCGGGQGLSWAVEPRKEEDFTGMFNFIDLFLVYFQLQRNYSQNSGNVHCLAVQNYKYPNQTLKNVITKLSETSINQLTTTTRYHHL